MLLSRLLTILTICLFSLLTPQVPLAAESYEERLAQIDRSNVDELFDLVKWCKERRMHSSANRHMREILAIDPNHAPTRELQGFVFDGKRWVTP